MSHSSTELIPSEAEDEEMELVELPETTSGCAFYELSAADPPSADRCSEATPRGPPSMDPEDEPENKRRRPRSCLKWLTSPVLRQSCALSADGIFEDYEGMIFPRSASVICLSLGMVAMAVFQTLQGAPMSDVRRLTACSGSRTCRRGHNSRTNRSVPPRRCFKRPLASRPCRRQHPKPCLTYKGSLDRTRSKNQQVRKNSNGYRYGAWPRWNGFPRPRAQNQT